MSAPVLTIPIPSIEMNELAAYGPLDLKKFFEPAQEEPLTFIAELTDGSALPPGLICTSDGLFSGIPRKGTEGAYPLNIIVQNKQGTITANTTLKIKSSLAGIDSDFYDQLKARTWEAIEQKIELPDLAELYGREVSLSDIYYILERWGTLKIWDAFNLDPAGRKELLNLEGASPHYFVFDRGSCLVATPKDLFSHERTPEDGLKTARAMAREVYKREWTIEFAGLDKMVRAAWVELQHLGDHHGKRLEILSFEPTLNDIKIYQDQALSRRMQKGYDSDR